MSNRQKISHVAGLTLIDALAGTIVATFVASIIIGLQVSVVKGAGGVNQYAKVQSVLTQATDQMLQDFSTATRGRTSWNELASDSDSVSDNIARWILEVPEMNATGTSAPIAHVVYEYRGDVGAGTSRYQVRRIYYPPGATVSTNTRVVANSVAQVKFPPCAADTSADVLTGCVDINIVHRAESALSADPLVPGSFMTRRVQAIYRNPSS